MEKKPEPKGIMPDQAAPPSPATPSRFQCLPVRPAIEDADDEAWEDEEDGFQCPCCLPR